MEPQGAAQKDVAGQTRLTLYGHSSTVRALAFSPDRETPILASASADHTVKLWFTATGQEYRTLRGHEDLVAGVLFSRDGKRLISGGMDGHVKFWDPWEAQESLDRPGEYAAVSPDGRLLATTRQTPRPPHFDGAKTVCLWEASTGRDLLLFKGHEHGSVTCVAFSSDSRLAASGAGFLSQGEILVWKTKTGDVVQRMGFAAGAIRLVAFSPDGRLLASASDGDSLIKTRGEIAFWDLRTGKLLLTAGVLEKQATSLAFSPDGKTLAVAVDDGPTELFDTRTGQEVRTWRQHSFTSAHFSDDGKLLITTGGDRYEGGRIWVWDADSGELAYELAGHSETVHAAAFSGDGRRIASAGGDGTVRLWDTETRQEILTLQHPGVVNGVAFSRDGTVLVSSSGNLFQAGFTKIWQSPRPPQNQRRNAP